MADEITLEILRNLHDRLLEVEVKTEHLSMPPPGVYSKTRRESFAQLIDRLSPEGEDTEEASRAA
jgi:hypothetical protein